jgi:hypothetical protein
MNAGRVDGPNARYRRAALVGIDRVRAPFPWAVAARRAVVIMPQIATCLHLRILDGPDTDPARNLGRASVQKPQRHGR